MGFPQKLTSEQRTVMIPMDYRNGMSWTDLSNKYGVHTSTIKYHVKRGEKRLAKAKPDFIKPRVAVSGVSLTLSVLKSNIDEDLKAEIVMRILSISPNI